MADVVAAFRKVEKIVAACWWEYSTAPEFLSVDDLHELVQKLFQTSIDMKAVAFRGTRTKGVIERYEVNGVKSAQVLVRRDLSEDERRLTAVKELCHVVIDEKSDFNPDGLETLAGLLADGPDTIPASVWSEHLARVMANELVYPHENRQPDADRVSRGETTIAQLVLQRKVPDYIVGNVLTPHYIKTCAGIWAQIWEEKKAT